MIEVRKISGVETIRAHSALGLFYKTVSDELYHLGKNELLAKNVHDFRLTSRSIVYTQAELGDLHVILNNNMEKVIPGFFYLSFFRELPQFYAIIKNDSPADLTNKVFLMDQTFEIFRPFKVFRAFINGYFAGGNRNGVTVFDEGLDKVWQQRLTEIDGSLSGDEALRRVFYETSQQIIIIPLSDGQLLAVDITTGELKWKQKRAGKTAIFDDRIYSIADYRIKELNSITGVTLREESMEHLIDSYDFRPTGDHKVYEKYIFCMSAGKPGKVAVYDRKRLKFQEMIILDEMIPMGTDNLIWHEDKLYILTFDRVLHVFV